MRKIYCPKCEIGELYQDEDSLEIIVCDTCDEVYVIEKIQGGLEFEMAANFN